MKLTLGWSVAICVVFGNRAGFWSRSKSSSAEAKPSVEVAVTNKATCADWASWVPPTTDPAVVMQVVSEDYVDLERNFIRLMELNSAFTRENLYLMCLDDASVSIFEALGIRCVPMGTLEMHSHKDLWEIRVRVVSCLVAEGYDVIMSDSDALWLGDPMEYINLSSSSSSVMASRGSFPSAIKSEWGATMCMGFIFFRATGAAMDTFQNTMERIVLETGDDQIAVNQAALELGIAWDKGSDMGYVTSVGIGKGTIAKLTSDDGKFFEISLLPHNKFTRQCDSTPISNDTIVAHCRSKKIPSDKTNWMQEQDIWSPDGCSP